ncbi:MAG: nitroreductase family deazaflavin-dependent oxidoreductase [Actinobacteria bacterium]|nr:nitroreductase family deazaflavin-dependent oxidoreductase [Actinomycetota bacterium]
MSRVPPVDPNAKQGPLQRGARAFTRTRFGTWFARVFVAPVEPHVIKATRGKVVIGFGFPTLNLTTRGRKSGKPRTTTLVYFTQGDDVVLIASSFGRDAHPAWYLNLKSEPHCELLSRGHGGRYVAREAGQAERERLFELAKHVYAGYQNYAEKTDRRIPVMVLSPSEHSPAA